jgi:hypothetical protein
VYHSKDNQKPFYTHGFKTVPYIAVSKQKAKRLDTEDFYAEEDKWLVRSDQISEAIKIVEFINNRLNTNVQLQFPFSVII